MSKLRNVRRRQWMRYINRMVALEARLEWGESEDEYGLPYITPITCAPGFERFHNREAHRRSRLNYLAQKGCR